jgi:addiction module HigA family antidote
MATISREDLDAGRVDFGDIVDPAQPSLGPIHPGEHLGHEFLEPAGITAYRLAKDIGVPYSRIAAILHGERALTADTALRLARYFGNSAEFWMGLQTAYDMAVAKAQIGPELDRITPRGA